MGSLSRRSVIQSAGLAAAAPSGRRPSVLFLMADQLRFDCLGANGNRLIRTPNLDRLAAGSANFRGACVQAPVCVPSRISYFTGRYPHSHKNRVNYTPCDRREAFLGAILQKAGWRTGSVGKLHFHPPTAEHARSTGFDVVYLDDGVSATDPYSDYVKWRQSHDPDAAVAYQAAVGPAGPGVNPFRARIGREFTPTAWTGAKTRDVLRELASSPQPFFLFSSFFKPHSPHTVPVPYDSMYSQSSIPLPERVTAAYIHSLPPPVRKMILRGKPVYGISQEQLQWIYRSYYAGVSMVDDEIGAILRELERSGRQNETIVIFAADHGDQLLEHGLFGKNVFFESSIRVPLMIRYPERVRPGTFHELIETVDVLPTVLELCGLPVPETVQGRSFAPLISGDRGAYQPREAVFAENVIPEVITGGSLDLPFEPGKGVGGIRHPDSKMIRTRRWKLNYYPGNGGELYDLESDPGEMRNLYLEPESAATRRQLQDRLLDWLITADENDQIARRWLV